MHDRLDGRVSNQMKYLSKYEAFSDFEKTLFHGFIGLIETTMQDPAARRQFSDFTRIDALRLSLQMADISDEPTSPNDFLLASDALFVLTESLMPVVDQCLTALRRYYSLSFYASLFILGIQPKTTLLPDLLFNSNMVSHLCTNPNCIWHVVSETKEENASRTTCQKYGSASRCQHRLLPTEPCQWNNEEGVYSDCRNDAELEQCVDGCEKNCFDGGLFLF